MANQSSNARVHVDTNTDTYTTIIYGTSSINNSSHPLYHNNNNQPGMISTKNTNCVIN